MITGSSQEGREEEEKGNKEAKHKQTREEIGFAIFVIYFKFKTTSFEFDFQVKEKLERLTSLGRDPIAVILLLFTFTPKD